MGKTHKTIPILDKMSPNDKERFWSKVDIKSEEECWPWKESTSPEGYGKFSVGGRENQHKLNSHRVAKTLSMGKEIEEGKLVLHACDNPPCCNPEHLFVADHQTNMDDMVSKNRSAISFGSAKTNWDTVNYIRNSNRSNNELVDELKLSKSTISDIRNNKTWKEEHRLSASVPMDTDVYKLIITDNDDVVFVI